LLDRLTKPKESSSKRPPSSNTPQPIFKRECYYNDVYYYMRRHKLNIKKKQTQKN
jgi:hypothetical protein